MAGSSTVSSVVSIEDSDVGSSKYSSAGSATISDVAAWAVSISAATGSGANLTLEGSVKIAGDGGSSEALACAGSGISGDVSMVSGFSEISKGGGNRERGRNGDLELIFRRSYRDGAAGRHDGDVLVAGGHDRRRRRLVFRVGKSRLGRRGGGFLDGFFRCLDRRFGRGLVKIFFSRFGNYFGCCRVGCFDLAAAGSGADSAIDSSDATDSGTAGDGIGGRLKDAVRMAASEMARDPFFVSFSFSFSFILRLTSRTGMRAAGAADGWAGNAEVLATVGADVSSLGSETGEDSSGVFATDSAASSMGFHRSSRKPGSPRAAFQNGDRKWTWQRDQDSGWAR